MADIQCIKRCGTCGEQREVALFGKHRAMVDGLQRRCKPCESVYYQANREKVAARLAAWKANNREKYLEGKRRYNEQNKAATSAAKKACYEQKREYYIAQQNANYYANREARVRASVEWAQRNRDKVRAAKSRYKHKRRAAEVASTFSVSGVDLVSEFHRHGGKCAYCHARFESFRAATWDHVVPVSRGGSFGIGNLVPACGPCNFSKQAKTVMEWRIWKVRRELAA